MGSRLKVYESRSENVLIPRLPVILRLDGNSFSKFTTRQGFDKPFDVRFNDAMDAAATAVLNYCSGAQVGYVQSDEITILLRNDQTYLTDPFLANRTQKIASLTAATASVAFNKALGTGTDAIFDCRVFVVPPHEVNNCFLWRQLDAFKNAVSTYAYWELSKIYGRKTTQMMLQGKSTNDRQEIIFRELGVNFNNLPTDLKRGRCIYKQVYEAVLWDTLSYSERKEFADKGIDMDRIVTRSKWIVDREIPRFNEDVGYIEKFMK